MQVSAIVAAAGRGLRFKSKLPKALVKINTLPMIIYSLRLLGRYPAIKEIIVVANRQNFKGISDTIRRYKTSKVKKIILGGRRRQDSVRQGLGAIDSRADIVLIHDAARPFVDKKIINNVIKEAKKCGATITGVPVKATIKEVHSSQCSAVHSKFIVKKTIDRKNLWEIQTPQAFRRDLILKAYKRFANIDVTDDAMLVEKLGAKVSVVLGSYKNIKITTPEDLVLAEAIAKNS